MSFKCKVFGHKWEYSVEDVTYIISGSVTKSTPNGVENTLLRNVRICSRCYYKQLNNIHFIPVHSMTYYKNLGYDLKRYDSGWSEFQLTKQELRDKKLKELGI